MQAQRTINDNSLKEHKKAELIERAMTMYFSHPMVDQIFQWDFMALGKRNMDEMELSRRQKTAGRALVWGDGSLKLNGKIYLWLINNHWRTNETVKTDENGVASFRGFKGKYRIQVTHNGKSKEFTAKLGDDNTTLDLKLEPLPWEGAEVGDFLVSPWFGAFEVSTNGWLNHAELMWSYVDYVTTSDNMWVYSLFLDVWVWSDKSTWPMVFNSASGSWVYYFNVPEVGVWKNDMAVGEWVFYPAG